jgi:hypothetical protein
MAKFCQIPDDPKTVILYRFIKMKRNILKLFCKLLSNNINAFITVNDSQYEFRAGLSAAHQIMHLLYDITTNFNDENGICVDAVFLDKNDAFDSIKF